MKKHTPGLSGGYILSYMLLLYPLTGIACASDSFEAALDSLFSAMDRTAESTFNNEFIYNPNTFNYDLNPIDPDIWQTEVPFAPEAFAALDATESMPILELDFSHEITESEAQAPLAPTKKHACTAPGCGYTTDLASYITIHMRYHADERPFKCPDPDCPYAAKTKSNLTGHMRNAHTGEKQFECPEPDCDYAATSRTNLTRHMLIHTGEKPYKCEEPDCNYTTAYRYHLTGHMRNRHSSDNPEVTPDPLFSFVNPSVESTFNEEITYNPDTYNYNLDAIDLDPWQTEIPFAPEASVTFDATENIPNLESDFRPETTTTTAQAPLAPTKTPTKKHTCTAPHCIYTTAVKSNLTSHMLTHTGEKPYKCPEPDCPYAATQPSHLKFHILTHTGEKPYKCPEPDCPYAATQQSHLKFHMLTHTGDKPHKCPELDCPYATATKSDLTRHIFIHTVEKAYKCPEPDCGYATTTKSNLTRHIRTHTGERPFKCPEPNCIYAAADRSCLTRHMRNMHTEEHPAKRQRSGLEHHTEPIAELLNPL